MPAPDPTTIHPVTGQERVVFLRPLIRSPKISIGEYTPLGPWVPAGRELDSQ